jgi:adenylate kinase family enzyme
MPWSFASQMITQFLLPIQRMVMYFITGKSELERIIANRTLPFSSRVHQIEKSIEFTSSKDLHQEVSQAKIEKNKSVIYDQLNIVIHKFDLYQKLIQQIEQIRLTKVTSTDEAHLELFEKIWSRLVIQSDDDHTPMSMHSKLWKKIGFQVCRENS